MIEQDGDTEPAHHARRPMNAFLIFCKRHRSVVRDKYPNLENRSITKILGEWWANLDKEEKACYTGLAKQYKDAFFSANPDFKWYKLPAPPLRTHTSRPRESSEKTSESPDIEYHEVELEKTNNNSTKVDLNKKPSDNVFEGEQKALSMSMFTPGKLADEAQMGGLSSLLSTKTEIKTPNPYYSPPSYKVNTISTEDRSHNIIDRTNMKGFTREESIRELQNALSETTKIFEEDFDEQKGRPYYGVPNDLFTNQDVIDQIVEKRYSRDDEFSYQRHWSDDEKNMRSGRSCKGKRYQEFMAVGGLIVNKRQKREYSDKMSDEDYNASCSWYPGSARGDEPAVYDDTKQAASPNELPAESEFKPDATDAPKPDNNSNKTFKAADFDLDAKIKALPSLSLEKFQQKKRENKRKKKTVNLKPKSFESSHIVNSVPRAAYPSDRREMVENWRDTVIGSQKRKPRKISITRLEINSLISSVDLKEAHNISPEFKIATEAPCAVIQNMEICKEQSHGNVDLLALATLAEVAANTSKLEDTSVVNNILAANPGEHASKPRVGKVAATNLDDNIMIAASEPLEFVPHGRTVLARHPEQIYGHASSSMSENSLLYKLTNFGIKDESLLEAKSEEEWWCVREVYYKTKDDFEEDPPSPKDTKEDMSDSFQPTSRLKNDFNISIKSELMAGVKRMDTESQSAGVSAGPSRASSANSSSNMSRRFKLDNGQGTTRKTMLNPKTDCCYEEELYVKGCTAVWSKGLVSTPATKLSSAEHRETIACYTLENPIKHAAFANFHISINNTMLLDALNSQIGDVKKNIKIEDSTAHLTTKVMPSILLIDNKCLRVYAVDGREYMTSIPFQVKKVWPMKYGVLLEKDATQLMQNSMLPTSFSKLNDSCNSSFSKSKTFGNMSAKLRAESISGFDHDVSLPTCFSLSHPLDEVSPILIKSPSHGLQYYNDGDIRIIFVSTNPSIILLYDCKLAMHSLWKIRKTTRDECLSMCPNMNSTTTVFSQSVDFGSPMHSNVGRNTTNPFTGSPFHSKRPGTPTRSRIDSPLANAFHQQGLSPHHSIGQASSTSMMVNNIQSPPTLPLYPDICLDHIWTDSQTMRRDPIENSTDIKTFLHTDLVGHEYLCFMIKVAGTSKLQILRLQRSHSHGQLCKTNLIVGAISSVLAKDAVVLDHLNMIALIDESGNIILQSGNQVVGKVHVGGVLARLIDSPYTKRSAFQSPFPRRSSLLPSRCHEASAFDDSALHLLSPVPHTTASRLERKETLGLRGISDACGARATLVFDTGAMYRISLPVVSSSQLLDYCISALKALLPSDITMQVIIKWYGVRNAPGSQDLTPSQEWSMFSNLLLSLIGYDVEHLSQTQTDEPDHGEVATKKQRTSSDGTTEDWDYLLNSKLHKAVGSTLATMLHLPVPTSDSKRRSIKKSQDTEKNAQFNINALLFPYTVQVLYAFHLIYEEIKLNTLLYSDLKPLSAFLYQIAKDLRLDGYVNHYWLDFPTEFNLEYCVEDSQMTDGVVNKLSQPSYFAAEPPNVFSYLNSMLKDLDVGCYPYLTDVNNMSKDLIEVLTTVGNGRNSGVQTISRRDNMASSTPRTRKGHTHYQAVLTMCERGITPRHIDNLPPALGLALLSICARCKASPPAGWARGAYALAMREELPPRGAAPAHEYMESLALEVLEKETAYSMNSNPVEEPAPSKNEEDTNTGMEHLNTKLLSLLYPRDHRMSEVFNLLQSSIPVTIDLTQRPEVSDHDFIEEQEKHLFAISTRTMALPVARGMLTLRTLPCAPTEPLTLPKLCVTGRGPPPRSNTITLGGADTSPHCLLWPTFHNGVAAGLALVPMTGTSIDSSWVVFNKPRGTQEMSTEHAGFLMALGLNGHLKDMPFMNIYEYLVRCNEMISVGLLLGIAATYRGTMDLQATKMMSIHLEALLPPTHVELDIQHGILVCALLGLGLVYQGTQHAHLAQVLLLEIGKPPGPEPESCAEREGYALAAGLALGLVCAGAGPQAHAAPARALRTYMLGGDRGTTTQPGAQRDKYKQSSYAIREGSNVNLDVTSPGATLALGLIYLKSNNEAIAGWLAPPTTAYLLDFVRPDLLMLRIIARGLIMWDSIEASEEWIENQVPSTIRPYCFVKPTDENVDYEAMNQAYCNIIAGACFALGLRFAGSGDEDARDAALHYTRLLLTVRGKSIAELAGRSTLEACLCVCLLSAGMIMAGRGDIGVLRYCRRLRARVPAAPPSPGAPAPAQPALTHGGQMAVHCTIGLLFLGGGRATLSTSATSIGALVAAFFPKFPTHSEDNRYHLQAFRHLYVLAVEPRLILPRDLSTGKLCYAHLQVIDLDGAVKEMKAPCIIPELDTLREVRVNDPRYWPITFQRDQNWDQLKTFLEYTWCIDIKQRAGCLSYLDDPQGFLTILAQTLTLDKTNIWSVTPENIDLFTNDDKVKNFVKHYLNKDTEGSICADCLLITKKRKGFKNEGFLPKQCVCRTYSREEREYVQGLSMVTYECVVKDILCALPIWTTFLKIIKTMKTNPSSYHMWQVKILLSQIDAHNRRVLNDMKIDGNDQNEPLMSSEFTLAIKQKVTHIFDSWEQRLTPYLRKYLGLTSTRKISATDDDVKRILSAFLTYHDLPRNVLKGVDSDSELEAILALEGLNLSADAVYKIESLVR